MKNWFMSRLTQKSTWLGLGALVTAITTGTIDGGTIATVLTGLGLIGVDA